MTALQFEELGAERSAVAAGGRLHRPQRAPDRRAQHGRPPLPAGVLQPLRRPLLQARQRHQPLRAPRALRRARASCSSARTRTRRRRARPGMLAIGSGGLEIAVAMAGHPFELATPLVVGVELRGRLPRLGAGQGRDPRAAAPARRARRRGRVFEFHGDGVATLSVSERGDDRQHDRRARRHDRACSRRTSARASGCAAQRREDAFVGARGRSRRGVRRDGGDRARRARAARRAAVLARQRRPRPRGRGHGDRAGLRRQLGQLGLRRPRDRRRGARRRRGAPAASTSR